MAETSVEPGRRRGGSRPDTPMRTLRQRVIGLMKFGLPMSALGLVLLVLGWANFGGQDLGFRLDFSSAGYNVSAGVQMVKPHFVGVGDNDEPFTVTAELATGDADDADLIRLDLPKADVTAADGGWFLLTAKNGLYNRVTGRLDLSGDVSIYTDTGLEFHTETAVVDFTAGTAAGDDPVQGQGPWGLIDSIGFRYDRGEGRLVFLGRPTLLLHQLGSM